MRSFSLFLDFSFNFSLFLFSFSVSDTRPAVISGLKELRVLKTTRSSFVDFVDDEFRSLPDMEDRLFR